MKLFSRIFSMLVIAFAFSVLFCTPTFAEESLSITVDGAPQVEVTPNVLGTGTVDVYVSSSSRDGYKLMISDSDNDNSLVSGFNSINPLAGSVTADNFTTNAWGIKVGDNYLPVPKLSDNVLELANTSVAATNEKHTVTFGMKVDGTAVSGDYSSEVVFTAVANPLVVRQTTLKTGKEVNVAWKGLARNGYYGYHTKNDNITSIEKYNGVFTDAIQASAVNIAINDSGDPVWSWFDNGTIYYYTTADEVFFNEDCSNMFDNFSALVSIDFNFGLENDVDPDGDDIITSIQDPVYITSRVANMEGMFTYTAALTTVDTSKFDTSNVTNMNRMFYFADALTTIDVSKWDTSKVANMSGMFNSHSITTLDVSKWDTRNVTNMSSMFNFATSINNLDVSKWDTSNVTTMYAMFNNTPALTAIDVSKWDTSKVTNMSWMFAGASSLTAIDVSKWDTSKVTNMSNMFHCTVALTTLDVSKWDTSSVTDMSLMFYADGRGSSITTLDVSKWNTSNVTNMENMFSMATSLATLDVSKWDTSSVTTMSNMFFHTPALTALDVSKWDTSSVTNMSDLFREATGLTTLDVSDWDTSNVTNMHGMFNHATALTSLDASKWDTSHVTNMGWMFNYATSLTTLDISNWDTSNVTDMENMFFDTYRLTTIYASNKFSTSVVTNGDEMFLHAYSLVGGNGTRYNSDHVDNEYARIDDIGTPGYFTAPRAVRKATLKTGQEVNAAWKTLAKGSNASYTEQDEIIKSIKPADNVPATFQAVAVNIATDDSDYPVYAWFEGDTTISLYTDADEVFLNADSSNMFGYLTRLSSINISFGVATDVDPDGDDIIVGRKDPVYITSNVTDMGSIFYYNSALTTLDLSGWDTSSVTNMEYMFAKLRNTTTIYASSLFDTSSVTNSSLMFYVTNSLVGGNGTTFSSAHTDKEYARIDAPGTPGYFTAKPAGN